MENAKKTLLLEMTGSIVYLSYKFSRRNNQYLLLFLCLTALFSTSAYMTGCTRKKPTAGFSSATTPRPVPFLLDKIQAGIPQQVHSLTAKADVYIAGEGGAVNATASIIWLRDSAVWINIKKLGLEMARALITRDSIFTLNRLEKTYSAGDLVTLQNQYHLPAGFPLIQLFIAGKPWFFSDIALQSGIRDSLHWLHGQNAEYSADYLVEENQWLVRQQQFGQKAGSRGVVLAFERFEEVAGLKNFPLRRTLTAASPETGKVEVEMDLRDIEINGPANYRFEVPAHYQKIDR